MRGAVPSNLHFESRGGRSWLPRHAAAFLSSIYNHYKPCIVFETERKQPKPLLFARNGPVRLGSVCKTITANKQ